MLLRMQVWVLVSSLACYGKELPIATVTSPVSETGGCSSTGYHGNDRWCYSLACGHPDHTFPGKCIVHTDYEDLASLNIII